MYRVQSAHLCESIWSRSVARDFVLPDNGQTAIDPELQMTNNLHFPPAASVAILGQPPVLTDYPFRFPDMDLANQVALEISVQLLKLPIQANPGHVCGITSQTGRLLGSVVPARPLPHRGRTGTVPGAAGASNNGHPPIPATTKNGRA